MKKLATLCLLFAALAGAVGVFAWYRRMTRREFGGITGDLLGYLVELSQLTLLFLLAFGSLFL